MQTLKMKRLHVNKFENMISVARIRQNWQPLQLRRDCGLAVWLRVSLAGKFCILISLREKSKTSTDDVRLPSRKL